MPILKEAGQQALRSAGVYDELFRNEGHSGRTNSDGAYVPLRNLEEALSTKASGDGAELVRGYTFGSVRGEPERSGRCEPVEVEIVRNDAEFARRGVDASRAPKSIRFTSDLIVVAAGGAAHADERLGASPDRGGLGLTYTELAARDVGAYGLYDSDDQTPINDKPVFFKQLLNKIARGGTQFAFKTEEHNYILYFFSGLSPSDLELLRDDPTMLRAILNRAGQASGPGFPALKNGPRSAALFDVTLGRVESPASPLYPAVVIGDAAVSPHPQTGSGINEGVGSLPALRRVVTALRPQLTDRFSSDRTVTARHEGALDQYGRTLGEFTRKKIVAGMFQMAEAMRFSAKKLTEDERSQWYEQWDRDLREALVRAETAATANDHVGFDRVTKEFDWLYADVRRETDSVSNLTSVSQAMDSAEQDRLAEKVRRERLRLAGGEGDLGLSELTELASSSN